MESEVKMITNLKEHVRNEFSSETTQASYIKIAGEGLWLSETYFFNKYFPNTKALFLDIGCGTGRTTIPLHEMGYNITGIDFVPAMIDNANKIAQERGLAINYQTGDATDLQFNDNTFDYALFSNQGWTQIPGKENRFKALCEIYRVLRKDGVFIFTAHPRVLGSIFSLFWWKQRFKYYLLRPLGFRISEVDFGDRFFSRGNIGSGSNFSSKQFIHIPSIREVVKQIHRTKFSILEINGSLQISEKDIRKHPPVYYVCKK